MGGLARGMGLEGPPPRFRLRDEDGILGKHEARKVLFVRWVRGCTEIGRAWMDSLEIILAGIF